MIKVPAPEADKCTLKNHYIYRITNTVLNKHYYGVRTAKNPKLDIGIKYFSSSSDKEFIRDQKDNPQNYRYKIIKIFDSRSDAIELEVKLHDRFNVGKNESFYNRSKQTSSGFDTCGTTTSRKGKKFSEIHKKNLSISHKGKSPSNETKIKLSEILSGKIRSDETKKKISEGKMGHLVSEETKKKISDTLSGTELSEETKRKISESQKKRKDIRKHTNETKKKISESQKGRKLSEETKRKMSTSHKNRELLKCPYCNKEGKGNVMYRFHFKKCKENKK